MVGGRLANQLCVPGKTYVCVSLFKPSQVSPITVQMHAEFMEGSYTLVAQARALEGGEWEWVGMQSQGSPPRSLTQHQG
eukprot:scaffold173576_cov14-Tisochrysis_lutea.AAC.1